MNPFQRVFEAKLELAKYKRVYRGDTMYWKKPSESGIIYDTAEAMLQLLVRPSSSEPTARSET